jgi:hypothetical protein
MQSIISSSSSSSSSSEESNNNEYSSKEIALAIAPKFTAFASILGSSCIVYLTIKELIRQKRQRKNNPRRRGRRDNNDTYHRFILGLGIGDLVASIAWFCTTWPVPKGTPNVYGAIGNQTTCSVQGFFTQFSFIAVMYNFNLSIYYVLVVACQYSKKQIITIEPYMHAIAIVVTMGTAIPMAVLGLYNPAVWDCWIAPKPLGCQETWDASFESTPNCERGDNASLYRFIFYYGPLWIIIIAIGILMFILVDYVRSIEKKLQRYNPTTTTATTTTATTTTSQQQAREDQQTKNYATTNNNSNNDDGDDDDDAKKLQRYNPTTTTTTATATTTAITTSQQQAREDQQIKNFASTNNNSSNNRSNNSNNDDDDDDDDAEKANNSSAVGSVIFNNINNLILERRNREQLKRTTEILHQALYYMGAFLFTWIFPTVFQITFLVSNHQVNYELLFMTAFIIPIQGLLNLIVYLRPKFIKQRRRLHRLNKQQQELLSLSLSLSTTMANATATSASLTEQQQQQGNDKIEFFLITWFRLLGEELEIINVNVNINNSNSNQS